LKKFISLLLIIILLGFNSVFAAEKVKFYAGIQTEFKTEGETPEFVEFVTSEDVNVKDIKIPANSLIRAKVHQFQKEKRWHKSGFFICNLAEYSPPDTDEPVDISDKEIFFAVRKSEPINKKDAAILSTEIVLTQAASIVGSCFIIFAPVDIAYFFTKGAIKKEKHPNWFKSGVMEAYDNSIFWFWLKGKPIELSEGDDVKLKSLSKERADKINSKIYKKKEKLITKNNKKLEKKLSKEQRKNKNSEIIEID